MPTASLLALLLTLDAHALSLSQVSESTPHPGITLTEYRTASPATNTFVARIDLCEPSIHVRATEAPGSLQTAGSWAADVGVQVAVNGDFYRTAPVRVYGRAVGEGIAWPLVQTGADPAYAAEWYWQDYGYLAFGHDAVEFTHTKWVKNNEATFGLQEGWAQTTLGPEPPLGTLSLVSGFPELVVEGTPIDCVSPTDAGCFPDRSDMRARHPRTAIGIDQDRTTLIIAVVDGRTTSSAGMYGEELADLMGQLGAYVAFNYDGGGSSQLWVQGQGYVNDASGNNSGGGIRGVANHWGVYAGGAAEVPERPGHCVLSEPCESIPPPGTTIDDDSACFRAFGPSIYWREEAVGQGGHLLWTNAWQSDVPGNWAWWQLDFEEAGEYLVEAWIEAGYGLYDSAEYAIVANGVEERVFIDQGASAGWTSLGSYTFAAGGSQYVGLYDDSSVAVASGQHIVADALRVTRLDLPKDTGDSGDTGGGADTSPVGDSGASDTAPQGGDAGGDEVSGACGCQVGHPGSASGLLLAGLFGLIWQRDRREGTVG